MKTKIINVDHPSVCRFAEYLRLRGKAPRTQQDYLRLVRQLEKHSRKDPSRSRNSTRVKAGTRGIRRRSPWNRGPNRRRAVRCRSEGQLTRQAGDAAPKLLTPAWLATFILALARDTGWHRDYILWELPLAELLLHQQATVFLGGQYWLVEPAPPVREQWGELFTKWQKRQA